jgi:hypothetical protein
MLWDPYQWSLFYKLLRCSNATFLVPPCLSPLRGGPHLQLMVCERFQPVSPRRKSIRPLSFRPSYHCLLLFGWFHFLQRGETQQISSITTFSLKKLWKRSSSFFPYKFIGSIFFNYFLFKTQNN